DVVGEALPGAVNAGHHRLAAELAFRADFARHAGDFRRERVELVDHRVDGVLQLQNFSGDVYRDLAPQVAARDGGRDLRDVPDLRREIRREQVDVVREVLPRTGHAGHLRLTAQPSLSADLPRHAGDFAGEGVQLIDHRVDGLLQLQNFAARV